MRGPFSTFPRGAQGAALILLRLSIAGGLFVQAPLSPFAVIAGFASATWATILLIPLAAMLCAGLLTPAAAVLSALFQGAVVLAGGVGAGAPILAVIPAIVLALLGPGRYSVDAYFFGPRILTTTSHGTGKTVRGPKR